jgi:hypothetical protein
LQHHDCDDHGKDGIRVGGEPFVSVPLSGQVGASYAWLKEPCAPRPFAHNYGSIVLRSTGVERWKLKEKWGDAIRILRVRVSVALQ